MMKSKLLIILLSCFLTGTLALSAQSIDKYELARLQIVDTAFWDVSGEVDMTIATTRNNFHYQLVKIVMSKQDNGIRLDMTALDNSWKKLFKADENPLGFFVRRGRLFIVATVDGSIDFNTYFATSDDTRFFSDRSTARWAIDVVSPQWKYIIKDRRVEVIDALNLTLLDKKRD